MYKLTAKFKVGDIFLSDQGRKIRISEVLYRDVPKDDVKWDFYELWDFYSSDKIAYFIDDITFESQQKDNKKTPVTINGWSSRERFFESNLLRWSKIEF